MGRENEGQGRRGIGGEREAEEVGEGGPRTGVCKVRFEAAAECERAQRKSGV